MSEFPTFEEFTADLPPRRQPYKRAKEIGKKAIELDDEEYYSLPFADDAKDSGVWLPKGLVCTLGRLRRLHEQKYTDFLFASAEQSAHDLTESSARFTASVERLANTSEKLLAVLTERDKEPEILRIDNQSGEGREA